MAWRTEGWADLVARAAAGAPRARRTLDAVDRAALAARAERVVHERARLELHDATLTIGIGLQSVEISLAQLYHVEPVDPWPSVALGWVDRGDPYRTVLTPCEGIDDPDALAAVVEEIVGHPRAASAAVRGWLSVAVQPWEPVESMPGEREEGPQMRGYRAAPEVPDPVVATRKVEPGASSMWTWIWARLAPAPRRIDAIEIVLTRAFVYARTRRGERLRIPASTLRTGRRTADGDTIAVFGRSTELLLVHRDGCPVAAELESRLGAELDRSAHETADRIG